MTSPTSAKLILILGPTGSGKSSLIASATGEKAIVGHTMQSCTQKTRAFRLEGRKSSTYLIDTRGFSDSEVSDVQNILGLAQSLCSREPCAIQGVIYLHSIKETRFTGTAQANLDLLQAICGDDFLPHVILATSMWDDLPPNLNLHQKFEQRHRELEEGYWKEMVGKGARVCKYIGSKASVMEMVDVLVNTEKVPPLLRMQKEALDLEILSETSVGKAVASKSVKARARLEKRLKEGDEEGDFEGDDGAIERRELQSSWQAIEDEIASLRVALPFQDSELARATKQQVSIWDLVKIYL
ncbi:P-loop containing nucleoside triphosphate hydrolase protein [Rhexocercosporidium sp. MPI-PUGE-AT-0058]|nr:P-loop containing nucleoside triphosphate hydrolase protein [Rhexocercosporidium sp. MPI-PUGE-AT-0058]